jgi:ABC-2 type transport system ATP-binding protein
MKLVLENISKKIKNKVILDNISIEFENSKIYGFVGRNGSGKTMLFRAICGLMKLDSGRILLDDKVLYKDMDILPNTGIIIENAGLYSEYTGLKNLQLLANINKKIGEDEVREALTRVGLDPDDKRTVRKYSLGMKQRLIIAQAIMEKPDIILLDEPTNALDENGVEEIRNIIQDERKRGAIILIASHNKEDIKLLSDKVFYMENGCIVKKEENEKEKNI